MRNDRRLSWTGCVLVSLFLALSWVGLPSQPVDAQDASWPAALSFTEIAGGFEKPVWITHAGDGSGRLFVVEQPGRIRIIAPDGTVLPAPFLDITERVGCCGERGLLSVAFPPGYAHKGHFYVNYTGQDGNTVVARFQVSSDSNVAIPSSEALILTVKQPYENHNGGLLAFSPVDGYLYIGMGDGGSAGDPQDRAQDASQLLGKLLRIDVESPGSGAPRPEGLNYIVPASNPYTSTVGYRPEIWALGLRNPWRFAFDRQNGDLYIGDVGQRKWEEIDYQPGSGTGGENYGWRILEGTHCFNPPGDCQPPDRYVPPVAEYEHPQGCSVTGGVTYRGVEYPALVGTYLYADYCTGLVWGLKNDGAAWHNHLFVDTPYIISTFGEQEDGRIYLADYQTGTFYQIGVAP